MKAGPTLQNRLTAALLALALVVLGFGHQHAPAAPADPMLAAYLQSGGTLDELCLPDGQAPHGMAQDCPVCTLAKAMALTPQPEQPATALAVSRAHPVCAGPLLALGHSPRAPPARAPPHHLS